MSKRRLPPRFGWVLTAFVITLIFVVAALIILIIDPGSRGELPPPAPASQTPAAHASSAIQPTASQPSTLKATIPPPPPPLTSTMPILHGDDRSPQLKRLTSSWKTDWTRHTIDYSEILSGGPPRDGIPSIDAPKFISPEEASSWLRAQEPVIALQVDGEARAYPLQILIWHEIVNDVIGGVPVAVTFCPLCNSAIAFDRRYGNHVFEFGVSGLLRNSDLIMYDRQTESLWQQFTGEGIVGEMAGAQLTWLPASIVSFEDFTATYPDGQVLSRDTGFTRSYGRNPYAGYDSVEQTPFLFDGPLDGRLAPMARVVTISLHGEDAAYPYDALKTKRVVHDQVGGQDIVIFYQPGTVSALNASQIAQSRDVGATGVFDPHLNGQTLSFSWDGERFVDDQTGSQWNILGVAVAGPLTGQRLTPILHADHFWFSWAAFKPDTRIYSD